MASTGGSEDTALDPQVLEGEDGATPESVARDAFLFRNRVRFAAIRSLLETDERRKPESYTPEFKFFQLIRLLERLQPQRMPVGRFTSPHREIVRFSSHNNLAFPASQVQELKWPKEGDGAPVMVVNFFGLTGPMGVLPHYYTELIRDRMRVRDTTLSSFFDMFNHRMISLFYQAWEKYRFTIAYERGERDRFSHILMDLIGIGTMGLQNRQEVADDSLLFYAGLLSMHTRPAAALQHILWDYFDVPVEIEQLVGSWYALDIPNQCKFDRANSFSEQMGVAAIVGDEIWDQQSGVLIRLGPLPLKKYLDFLPTGTAYAPLRAILRFFSGWEIDFQVQLVLKRDETPPCELGATGDESPRLGWVSWSKTLAMNRDPDDTILRI
jgi:type VI secretion system protein ImpH